MKKLLLITLLLIVGCTTVPVTRNFPSIPKSLDTSCTELELLKKTSKLSDILVVVTNNYTLYNECKIKSETWLKWYKEQKEIFEHVK